MTLNYFSFFLAVDFNSKLVCINIICMKILSHCIASQAVLVLCSGKTKLCYMKIILPIKKGFMQSNTSSYACSSSSLLKPDFADDGAFWAIVSSVVGRTRHQGIMFEMEQKDSYIGDVSYSKLGVLTLEKHGILITFLFCHLFTLFQEVFFHQVPTFVATLFQIFSLLYV